jgi:transcriptional regulator with XRE-family HTH domain
MPAGRTLSQPDLSTFPGRFGARLRTLRLRKFATVRQFVEALAEKSLRVNVQAAIKWETGRNLPPLGKLPQIAETLGVTVASLFR